MPTPTFRCSTTVTAYSSSHTRFGREPGPAVAAPRVQRPLIVHHPPTPVKGEPEVKITATGGLPRPSPFHVLRPEAKPAVSAIVWILCLSNWPVSFCTLLW